MAVHRRTRRASLACLALAAGSATVSASPPAGASMSGDAGHRSAGGVPAGPAGAMAWGGAGATERGQIVVAQAQPVSPVGQAPQDSEQPAQPAPIFEQPGVLTPRGKLLLEPSLQYSHSSSNRVALVGYTIIPSILIGLIDVREVKRNTFTAALTARYGLTNRFEVELKAPFVRRTDSAVGREFLQGAAESRVFDTSGSGLGDVEVTGRYQLNDGGVTNPYYVASLRFKSRTGKDPFEVETSRNVEGFRDGGIQTELPTGSGFYSLQPALTVLFPSDPVVLFGTISYTHNFKRTDVTRVTDAEPEFLGTIEPGGIFGFNFGMGLALNEKASLSMGYEHNSVGKTRQNGAKAPDAVRVQLGSLLFGFSYRLSDKRSLNLSIGAGLTQDSPDVTLTLRLPVSM